LFELQSLAHHGFRNRRPVDALGDHLAIAVQRRKGTD
jgi:hypothetical protein